MRRRETQQRKRALVGLKRTAGMDWMLGPLVRVIRSWKHVLDAVMLEMGRMVAESVMLMEREGRGRAGLLSDRPGVSEMGP